MAHNEIELGQQAVNLAKRLYWCEAFGARPITTFFDCFGEETNEETEAVTAVVHLSDRHWLAIDLRDYESSWEH